MAGEEGDAAQDFRGDGQVGEGAGQAQRLEELDGAGGGEDEVLEEAVGDEHRAQREPQQQRGEVDSAVVHEGSLVGSGGGGAAVRGLSRLRDSG